MQHALERGEITPELRAKLYDPAMRRMHFIELVGVMMVMFLMVFKPF
jgi:hypothetical protein